MTQKLDAEHADAIQQMQDQYAETTAKLGQITLNVHYAETQLQQLKQQQTEILNTFNALQEKETKLMETLKARYGEGQINIQDGTFTPDSAV